MNSTINKTFYTCSTESLFLRYKKISKKAVKLGSFLQCSVHIFLGHDGCFWKINLRILWNHIMENFQIKHGQCGNIIFPKTFSFESLADSRILCFWQILKSIYKFIIELHVLQCVFVRVPIKNKGGVGLFQISQKGDSFISYSNHVLLLFLHLPKKAFSPSVWPKRVYTWTINWK